MIRALLLSAVVAVAFGAAYPKLDGRIVGGKDTTIEQYPYQVSLLANGNHNCGGTLIDSKTVVTAAHCTVGRNTQNLQIRCDSSTKNAGGQVLKIREINQHPKYDGSKINNDVTVLHLDGECKGAPARLPTSSDKLVDGDDVYVTGWGALTEGGGSPTQLQVVTVQVVSNKKCNDAYGSGSITDQMMCAGVPKGGKDACQGDSGGPLVRDNILWGVVSWGYGCARPDYPGVYASVSGLIDFIKSVTQK